MWRYVSVERLPLSDEVPTQHSLVLGVGAYCGLTVSDCGACLDSTFVQHVTDLQAGLSIHLCNRLIRMRSRPRKLRTVIWSDRTPADVLHSLSEKFQTVCATVQEHLAKVVLQIHPKGKRSCCFLVMVTGSSNLLYFMMVEGHTDTTNAVTVWALKRLKWNLHAESSKGSRHKWPSIGTLHCFQAIHMGVCLTAQLGASEQERT